MVMPPGSATFSGLQWIRPPPAGCFRSRLDLDTTHQGTTSAEIPVHVDVWHPRAAGAFLESGQLGS